MENYANAVFEELCLFPEFYARGYSNHKPHSVGITTFADGEIEAVLDLTIRGKDIFLFANSGRSMIDHDPAKAKIQLYNTVDAIRRCDPGRVILFEPYCSPARSDRAMGRSSVALWVHFKILANLGVNYILTYQLHSNKSKSIVDPTICSIEDIPATLQLMEFIASNYVKTKQKLDEEVKNNWLFCSVDSSGESMARDFALAFHTDFINSYKQRDYTRVNTIESVNILSSTDLGEKEIWIVDDMIDTGGSVEAILRSLAKKKVKSVHVAVIHPVFSHPALERFQTLYEEGLFEDIVTLDTIPRANLEKEYPFIKVVPSQRMSAQIVMRLHEGKSFSPFFDKFDIDRYLSQLSYQLF